METSRRTFLALCAATSAVSLLSTDIAFGASIPLASAADARLTNLEHLRFLLADVPIAASATHTTYGIDTRAVVRAPWTYADSDGLGGFRRVGGGNLDPLTSYWSQGAYNADDIA